MLRALDEVFIPQVHHVNVLRIDHVVHSLLPEDRRQAAFTALESETSVIRLLHYALTVVVSNKRMQNSFVVANEDTNVLAVQC